MTTNPSAPAPDCGLCSRLAKYRSENKIAYPDGHNAPVDSFGPSDAPLLIVGLAPGVKGANATGRPFTGDFAGDLLYSTLISFGLAKGQYDARADDGLTLVDCRITNAVRCVPPQNKPTTAEINTCRPFLAGEINRPGPPKVLLALGTIAHGSVLTTLGERKSAYPFSHCAVHRLSGGQVLVDSYHCSRYNTNTKRLTESMFHDVFATIVELIR